MLHQATPPHSPVPAETGGPDTTSPEPCRQGEGEGGCTHRPRADGGTESETTSAAAAAAAAAQRQPLPTFETRR